MLFNSYEFIFLFLPITLIGFFTIGNRGHHRIAIAWIVGASLFFYGWWNPAYLGLIVGSILFNYAIGVSLADRGGSSKKALLVFGIAANLTLLGYFKYANFFVDNIDLLFKTDFNLETIILPLAISFFTFQQITYLVDAYRGETREYNFLHYCLFVLFFPQLIAGPIVHHKEMLPQFSQDILYRLRSKNLAVGITIFLIGLFKKVVLADGVAVYATPVFQAADSGIALSFFEAWAGALAYTFQLYFDFSGYSDMAIGLARMFGVRLPLNFNSPYKATNIIDFWRRWHITLSRFLRDYLYIPLGGNRKGKAHRHLNLMTTMLLGGLWHGAGWNFMLWGGLHGLYLIINHAWRSVFPVTNVSGYSRRIFGWTVTFLAVVVSWVPFRAETMGGTRNILSGMFGLNGISLPQQLLGRIGKLEESLSELGLTFGGLYPNVHISVSNSLVFIFLLLLATICLPNTQQLMRRYRPAFETYKGEISRITWRWLEWSPTRPWAVFLSIIVINIIIFSNRVSEFLYFQF